MLEDKEVISNVADLLDLNPKAPQIPLSNPLEAENLALKSVLNTFIEKIYRLKAVEFEDQSIKDIKLVNSAAFDLLDQVTQIIKQDR